MNIRDQNEFMAGQPISARALNELARQVQENTLTVAAPLTMTRSPYGTALAVNNNGSSLSQYLKTDLVSTTEPGNFVLLPSVPAGVYIYSFRIVMSVPVYTFAGNLQDGVVAQFNSAPAISYPNYWYSFGGVNATSATTPTSLVISATALLVVPSAMNIQINVSMPRATSSRQYDMTEISAIKLGEYTNLTTTNL